MTSTTENDRLYAARMATLYDTKNKDVDISYEQLKIVLEVYVGRDYDQQILLKISNSRMRMLRRHTHLVKQHEDGEINQATFESKSDESDTRCKEELKQILGATHPAYKKLVG